MQNYIISFRVNTEYVNFETLWKTTLLMGTTLSYDEIPQPFCILLYLFVETAVEKIHVFKISVFPPTPKDTTPPRGDRCAIAIRIHVPARCAKEVGPVTASRTRRRRRISGSQNGIWQLRVQLILGETPRYYMFDFHHIIYLRFKLHNVMAAHRDRIYRTILRINLLLGVRLGPLVIFSKLSFPRLNSVHDLNLILK